MSTWYQFENDDDFIYHIVEGSQGSRAYLAGPFNNTVVHSFNNLVKINIVHSTGTTKNTKQNVDKDEG